MCRLAAYIGPELLLDKLLNEQPHSLVKQSWDPKEMVEAKLNADGFGFGWYTPQQLPVRYTSVLPIWSDTNVTGLSQSLNSRIWMANVRSATPGQEIGEVNTQPFISGKYVYLHNGYIEGFNPNIRKKFHEVLTADIQSTIRGNTDSEYVFALFRQFLAAGTDTDADALLETLRLLEQIFDGNKGLLNLVICDGSSILACRHSINHDKCPSMYYTTTHPSFPDATLIASERFSSPESWLEFDNHSLLAFSVDGPIQSFSL